MLENTQKSQQKGMFFSYKKNGKIWRNSGRSRFGLKETQPDIVQ